MYQRYCNYEDDDYNQYHRYFKPDYFDVELGDVPLSKNGLFDTETVITQNELENLGVYKPINGLNNWNKNQSSVGFIYNPNTTYKATNKSINRCYGGTCLNPVDGDFLLQNTDCKIALSARVNKEDNLSWQYFASTALEVYSNGSKESLSEGNPTKKHILSRFTVKLRKGLSIGHIQFIQRAKGGAENSKGNYPYGTILTFFVFNCLEKDLDKYLNPPLLAVLPRSHQTFVPIHSNQTLQVILPETYSLTTINKTKNPFDPVKVRKADNAAYDCYYFKGNTDYIKETYPIMFASKTADHQGALLVSPVERFGLDKYVIVHTPMDKMVVYFNNVDGLIFRTNQDIFANRSGYFDIGKVLRIDSKYKLSTKNETAYDVSIKLIDKSIKALQINKIFDANACTVRTL